MSNLPAAHGMAFAPFTRHLILMGSTHLTPIDPGPPVTVVSDLVVEHVDQGTIRYNVQFDQGTVDGQGHIYAASNSCHLVFVDYSATGRIGDPKNFKSVQFLADKLDDVAPLVGPGAIKVLTTPPKIEVIEERGRIRIVLPAAILFDFDRFNQRPSAEVALTGVKGSIIDRYPGAHLLIEGYTDDRGSQEYNLKLSDRRAQSVADWLTRHGIQVSQLETHGTARSGPALDTNDENRARYRRVEIIVVKWEGI